MCILCDEADPEKEKAKNKKRAKELLQHEGRFGNHGFKGEQLKAWREMRKAIVEALRETARTGEVADYGYLDCPRDAAERMIWIPAKYDVKKDLYTQGKWVKNPKYSNGTAAGARWVDRCSRFLN